MVLRGVLCRRLQAVPNLPEALQTVVPEALQEEVLSDLHEGVMGGHLGTDKTLGRLNTLGSIITFSVYTHDHKFFYVRRHYASVTPGPTRTRKLRYMYLY